MAPYDSESSDEGEDYTETNVLLGYASQGASGDAISHLGGSPAWIDETTPPSGELAKCKVCKGLLTLLLELNGDLPEHFPSHERRLYIWCCRRKTCRRQEGSVRAIRGVRIAKGANKFTEKMAEKQKVKPEEGKPLPQLGEALFGVKNGPNPGGSSSPFANPFSSKSNGTTPSNPFAKTRPETNTTQDESKDEIMTSLPKTFADTVRLSSPPTPSSTQPARPHEPWPSISAFPSAFPHYYLDAEYETLDAPSALPVPANVRMDVDTEGGSGGGGKEDKEIFESSLDKTFQKFADRVGQNPEQALRYEFNGKPLLYSDNDAVGRLLAGHSEYGSSSHAKITSVGSRGGSGIPRCQNCGADRVFEVQLTPHTIVELEANEISVDGMEWGTIILGTCSKDCKPNDVPEGEVGYVEDWVGVQWEEVASKK